MDRLRKRINVVVLVISVWSLLCALSGCDRVTRDNYNRLSVGMEYDDVVDILGQPTACRSLLQARSCTWEDAPRVITIQFVGDKVAVFSSRGL